MPTIVFEDALQELFTDLHHSKHFADGKEISDAILENNPAKILTLYRQEKTKEGFDLIQFYHRHFKKAPKRATNYKSDTNLSVETHIKKLWSVLARQPEKLEKYSTLIPLPFPYIVPGGRFNEIYYWDSYFTMLGLQESGEIVMIENMVDNFSWLIDRYGFIPNGSRSYFLGRSQPPFYALMINLLAEEKGNEVYTKYLSTLEKEYQFWMTGLEERAKTTKRVVKYKDNKTLNRYYDNINRPRTEMYLDDVELIEKGGEAAKKMILNIRAACESGWDFSSRWCADPLDLATIHTTDILPVDLNCLLYFLETILAKANQIKGNHQISQNYQSLATQRKANINDVFWNETTGFYHDYDFVLKKQTKIVSLAGIFPLFFQLSNKTQAAACAKIIEKEFLKAGGVVTTPINSGQQWDAPNGWAPLQWMTIKGLRNYGFDDLAKTISERWINLNTKVYQNTGKLMEKYNVIDTNLKSGGGEYPVQDGFGWTNGVLLKLINC